MRYFFKTPLLVSKLNVEVLGKKKNLLNTKLFHCPSCVDCGVARLTEKCRRNGLVGERHCETEMDISFIPVSFKIHLTGYAD